MPVLTGIDILGIQGYVFASNRLRDVLAASWMVDHVMSPELLAQWGLTPDRVLLAAGGNAIIEFDSLDTARGWTAHYTRWLLDAAPGLEAVVAHRRYENRPLAWALKALQIDLAQAKLERRPNAPQLGLSVTASCEITGLPATDVNQGDLVSPRVKRLREKVGEAMERWIVFLPKLARVPGWTAEFPEELDLMGRTSGETSLIGVVHVDGNGVGKAISKWLDRCIKNSEGNDDVRKQFRDWSLAIVDLGRKVLKVVATRVAGCVEPKGDKLVLRGTPDDLAFDLRSKGTNSVFLPLRPILLGGDDLTFVCDGRIALDLAVIALEEFEKHPIPHLGEGSNKTSLTACAGVAVVKAHAPFQRSYELAEGLCQSAKHARKDAETGCWLDWHVGSTRPSESVEEVRKRQYRRGGIDLSMRPYPLIAYDNRTQSWEWFEKELLGPGDSSQTAEQGFRGSDHWAESRSRVKLLASLVPRGTAEIRGQLETWRALDSTMSLPAGLDEGGYIGSQTPLLDAIELMDLHIRLEPDPRPITGGQAATTAAATAREDDSQ